MRLVSSLCHREQVRTTLHIALLGATCLVAIAAAAAAQEGALSGSVYADPKNYFKIVPPNGWSIREYPEDPRGKVDFDVTPGTMAAQLKVIAGASPYASFEALKKDVEVQVRRMQERFGATIDVQTISVDGEPAVRALLQIPGKLKQLNLQYLRGKTHCTFAFGARPDVFEKYESMVSMSIDSFQAIPREWSKEEAARFVVAGAIRRATLYVQMGRKDWAIVAIEEGLAQSPNNPELVQLRRDVQKIP